MNRQARMSPRRQSASTLGICGNGRIGQSGVDKLRVSSSTSPSSFPKTGRRERQPPGSEKPRSVPTKSARRAPVIARARPRSGAVTSGIPEDVAVHFGNFYGRDSPSTKGGEGRYDAAGTTRPEYPASEAPRSEFTRQMVHELERLAGTKDYARQVSALLDSTVESPNFDVKPPPADNFVPYQRSGPSDYPLWYKEPDKMLSSTDVGLAGRGNQTRKPGDVSRALIMNSARVASENRRSADATDCENNDESSCASSSEPTSDSEANTEEDSDCDEVKVAIVVK